MIKISNDQRRTLMEECPPYKLIPKMALPTIIAMLVDSLYNLADTFFVSSIGESATAAVGINDSFMHILLSLSAAFGFGVASYTARLLGAKEDEHASIVASSTFFIGLITSFLFLLICFPFRAAIVEAFGSTKDALSYSIDYSTWILLAFPFTMSNSILSQLLKSEGNTTYSMIGTVSGCVINCILDPLFINTFKWEVAGAAAATALSKVISFIVLSRPFIQKKTIISLSFKLFKPHKADVLDVFKSGLPTFLRMSLVTFGSILTNRTAKEFGTAVLAAISIANKVNKFISSAIIGFTQGFAPCVGYCYGARKYKRTSELYKATLTMGLCGGLVLSALMYIFSAPLIQAFNHSNNPEVLSIGVFNLRALSFGLLPHMFIMITNHLYHALGKVLGNTILGLSRQIIFLVPLILILPNYFGAFGLAACQGLSDVLAGIFLAIPFALSIKNKLNKLAKDNNE